MTTYGAGIVLALACALAWGANNVLLKSVGYPATRQTLGLAVGNLVISSVVFPWGRLASIPLRSMLVALISGATWAVGMQLFLSSIPLVGIARAVPVCGSLQVAFNTLFGGLVTNEFPSSDLGKVAMTCGVALILISMPLATWGQQMVSARSDEGRGFLTVVVAAVVFSFYVAPIRYFQIPGEVAGLPQAVGMVIVASALQCLIGLSGGTHVGVPHPPFAKALVPGLTWGMGNVLLLFAITRIGVGVAFTLTRLSVVVSSAFGVFYFREAQGRSAVPVLSAALTSILGSIALSLAGSL